MGLMCLIFVICALRTNVALVTVHFGLMMTFLLLAGSYWETAQNATDLAYTLQQVSQPFHALLLLVLLLLLYLVLSFFYFSLSQFPTSPLPSSLSLILPPQSSSSLKRHFLPQKANGRIQQLPRHQEHSASSPASPAGGSSSRKCSTPWISPCSCPWAISAMLSRGER